MKPRWAVEVGEVALPWHSEEEEARVHAALNAAGQRPTGVRLCTLQILLAAQEALTAQAVYSQLLKAGVGIHLSSIYRALTDMEKVHLVLREWRDCIGGKKAAYRIGIEQGAMRRRGAMPQCEVRCRVCGNDFSSDDHDLRARLAQLTRKHGLALSAAPVTIEMTCNACALAAAPTPG